MYDLIIEDSGELDDILNWNNRVITLIQSIENEVFF